GILSLQPPKVGEPFPVLVPQVNEDGNERDGVRLPAITLPLATYTSWNLRDPSIGAPTERVSFEASDIPFPKTAADRERTHHPGTRGPGAHRTACTLLRAESRPATHPLSHRDFVWRSAAKNSASPCRNQTSRLNQTTHCHNRCSDRALERADRTAHR